MNQKVRPQNQLTQGGENDRRAFFSNFAISSICHLFFFVILIFAPGYASHNKPSFSVINVSIVTLPSQELASLPVKQPTAENKSRPVEKKKEPVAKISTKTIPETVQKPKASISLNPKKKKIKQSLKKKTFKSDKVVKSAINKIEKKVENATSDQVKQAIARLKSQVEKTGPASPGKQQKTPKKGLPGGTDAGSKKTLEIMDIYQVEIAYRIQKNWAFSEQIAGGRTDLEAWAAVKIMPNGEIKDIWFDKRSGSSYFDEAAKKAIIKSNPLPPLPKGYYRPYFEAGFHFTPSGISK